MASARLGCDMVRLDDLSFWYSIPWLGEEKGTRSDSSTREKRDC